MDLENSRIHNTWWLIGFTVASVGLFIASWCFPTWAPITFPLAIGSSVASFTHVKVVESNAESIKKILEYAVQLHQYVKLVENDIKTTDKINEFFDQAQLMLTE